VAAGRFRATIASDRYLYIPIVFLAAALAAALVPRAATDRKVAPEAKSALVPWVAAALALVLAVPLALATRAETARWKDERLVWDRVNRFAPHYMAYHSLGKLAFDAEDWSGAASHFERALALARKDPYIKDDSFYYSAFMQTSRKAAEALQQNPDPAAQAERDRLLAEAGAVAEEAAKKLPGDAGLQFEAGKTKYKQKLYREAIIALDSAIALDPRHDQAWMYKAMCQYYLGEVEPSIASFRTALGIRKHTLTYSNLTKVLAAQSRFAETADVLLEWLEVEPTQRDAHSRYLQVVGAMVEGGQGSAAAASLTRYLARFPDSPGARELLARARSAGGPAA
jgi:tetratricopeptide (TPR) repeat protein